MALFLFDENARAAAHQAGLDEWAYYDLMRENHDRIERLIQRYHSSGYKRDKRGRARWSVARYQVAVEKMHTRFWQAVFRRFPDVKPKAAITANRNGAFKLDEHTLLVYSG